MNKDKYINCSSACIKQTYMLYDSKSHTDHCVHHRVDISLFIHQISFHGFSCPTYGLYPGLDHISGHLRKFLNLRKMRSLWLIVGFDLEWSGTKSKQETDISPKTINRKQLLHTRRPNIPESFSSERPNSSRPSNNATCPPNLLTPPPATSLPPPHPHPAKSKPKQCFFYLQILRQCLEDPVA